MRSLLIRAAALAIARARRLLAGALPRASAPSRCGAHSAVLLRPEPGLKLAYGAVGRSAHDGSVQSSSLAPHLGYMRAYGLGLAVTIAAAMALIVPSSSQALVHGWSCNIAASNNCFDPGTPYHSWDWVVGQIEQGPVAQTCSSGITEAGNVRQGSGCSPGSRHDACFSGGTPMTWAWVAWGNSGTKVVDGTAFTPDSGVCV